MPQEISPLLARTKSLLKQSHLNARKSLGQHFLIDPDAANASISVADLSHKDTVVEVGPGLGALTEKMVALAGRVIAVELDLSLVNILERLFADKPNLMILQENILKVDMENSFPNSDYKVVANLPYYAAAPAIRRFLETSNKPSRMVVMVQKEVGDSICAVKGKMSILSVSVQLYAKPTIVQYVPASSFYPPPKVDSAILCLDVYPSSIVDVEPESFFRVVKAGFSAPRKQLRNALAHGLAVQPNEAEAYLNVAGISPKRRAETLNLEEWSNLYQSVTGGSGC